MDLASADIGSALSPISPQAESLRFLIITVISLCGVIALMVTGLVTYAVIRYRDRGTSGEPQQSGGNRKVEIAYTVIPLCIQVCLFCLTVFIMRRAEPNEPSRSPDLIVTAHQWWWELRYPDGKIITANEIHLPVGKTTWVELRSADVIHELWVPELGPKMDTVPGKPNHLLLQPTRIGVYLGNCAEFCGVGHAWMRVRVVVESREDFAAWEQRQSRPATNTFGDATRGRQVFEQQSCIQCHSIQDVSIIGSVGPDLTHFGSRATLGAGVLDNTLANLALWLRDPQAIKPGCYMPNMRLSSKDVDALTAYLEALK